MGKIPEVFGNVGLTWFCVTHALERRCIAFVAYQLLWLVVTFTRHREVYYQAFGGVGHILTTTITLGGGAKSARQCRGAHPHLA
jgi:hypothetical protein